MGFCGLRTLTRSSMRLCSTRLWAAGRSSCVRSCRQLPHSSLPGRLSWPQLGQIMAAFKFKIRTSKSEAISESENSNRLEIRNLKQDFVFRISDFKFVSDFVLRISDLLNHPGIVASEKFFELAAAFLGHDILELSVEKIVVGGMLHAAIDPDAFRKTRIDHPAQEISQTWLLGFLIVDEQIVDGDAAAQGHDFGIQPV